MPAAGVLESGDRPSDRVRFVHLAPRDRLGGANGTAEVHHVHRTRERTTRWTFWHPLASGLSRNAERRVSR